MIELGDIDPEDKISQIKEKIQEKSGALIHQQQLIFAGRQMVNRKTVKELNIVDGSVLHLVLKLRGRF